MNANREKTSSAMGLIVSVLLHAIFLAGCYAFDASSAIQQSTSDPTANHASNDAGQKHVAQPKS